MHRLSADQGVVKILFVIVVSSTAVWAQLIGASVAGTVKDPTGAVLAGAAITVTNVETGAVRSTVADESGRYTVPSVPVGLYQVRAEKAGFQSQLKTGIQLVVGQSTVIDLTLAVGPVVQDVTVVEVIPPINLSTQETSGLVSERQVKSLPLNGRTYDQLLTLNPGIVNYTSQRAGRELTTPWSETCLPCPGAGHRRISTS